MINIENLTDEEYKELMENPDYCHKCKEIDCGVCHCCQCSDD